MKNGLDERVQRLVDFARPGVGRDSLGDSLSRGLDDPVRLADGSDNFRQVATALRLSREGEHVLHSFGQASPVFAKDRLDVCRQLPQSFEVKLALFR